MRFTAAIVVASTVVLSTFAPRIGAESAPAAPMDTRRSAHTATLLPNGKVLVLGGEDGSNNFSSGELYDWSNDTWSSGPALLIARDYHTATLLGNGKVLVVGGFDGDFRIVASAELYDPVANRSGSAASVPGARVGHTATLLLDGRVLVVGGQLASGGSTADVQLYNPASDTWSNGASLPGPRNRHTATLLPNGKVAVFGGSVGPSGGGELYDPALGTWTRIADITQTRQRHTATLLPNGKVLILGGTDSPLGTPVGLRVLVSAELYDPVADTWTDAPALTTARLHATATLLPNGLVLVAGGRIQESSTVVATTELYAVSAPAVAVDVVEYFNVSLDHYFITWLPSEIAALDAGTIRGWGRTGHTFKTHTTPQALTSPVCRYYLPPQYGDSHFFGRGTSECDATGRNNPGFILEDTTFMRMSLPATGTCPVGTTPIYRVFSNRTDANHRYTIDRAVRDQMVARGWLAEGDGPDLVVMCAPS